MEEIRRNTLNPYSVGEYMRSQMNKDRAIFVAEKARKTGLNKLDDMMYGGMRKGVYIIAGKPGSGKTTLVSQIADQMAAAGEHVLFFYTQSDMQNIVAKSIARYAALEHPEQSLAGRDAKDQAWTSAQIYCSDPKNWPPIIAQAFEAYQQNVADRVSIITRNRQYTWKCIRDYVDRYMRDNNVSPVVIIDSLNDLSPEPDYHIQLGRMAHEIGAPVIVTCGIDPRFYNEPADMFTLDAPDYIEDSAEAVICLNDGPKNKTCLDIVKHRSGPTGSLQFKYHKAHDYFEPVEVFERRKEDDEIL